MIVVSSLICTGMMSSFHYYYSYIKFYNKINKNAMNLTHNITLSDWSSGDLMIFLQINSKQLKQCKQANKYTY